GNDHVAQRVQGWRIVYRIDSQIEAAAGAQNAVAGHERDGGRAGKVRLWRDGGGEIGRGTAEENVRRRHQEGVRGEGRHGQGGGIGACGDGERDDLGSVFGRGLGRDG